MTDRVTARGSEGSGAADSTRTGTPSDRQLQARPSAVLDEAHLGDIEGAFGRISVGEVGERPYMEATAPDPGGHRRAGHHRHGRRQRRRRCLYLRPGRAELPHHAAVDAAAADPCADRQPGDGCQARSRHRRGPCPAHQRALRTRLGLVQRRGPFSPQFPDHRHRVHRHIPGGLLRRYRHTYRCLRLRWLWWPSWRPAASRSGSGPCSPSLPSA